MQGRFLAGALFAEQPAQVAVQDLPHQGAFAAAAHPGDADQPLQREGDPRLFKIMEVGADDCEPGRAVFARPAGPLLDQRVAQGMGEKPSGYRLGAGHQLSDGAGGDHPPAVDSGAGAQVDQVFGAADGFLVVLDHHHRVPFALELAQGIEQHAVVAGMQADGRLVENVADPPQVGAQLRGQADALGLAPREGRRRPVEAQIAQADLLEEGQPRAQLGEDVAGDLGLAPGQRHRSEKIFHPRHRQGDEFGDAAAVKTHRQRLRAQPLTAAVRADPFAPLPPLVPPDLLAALLGVEPRHQQAGPEAAAAPAVLGVEGEKPRIELLEAAPAAGAGPPGGKDLPGRRGGSGNRQLHQALAVIEGTVERFSQLRLILRRHPQFGHRQFDVVLLEAVEARPVVGGGIEAVHPQVGKALARRPLGKIGVIALAGRHQRREERDAVAAMRPEDAGEDRLAGLGFDGDVAPGAVLGAELDEEQAQEMIDLGQGRHGALAAAAAGALFDGHRRRDAENGVDVGAGGRLHELSGIGIERFEVAALAFVEQDVESHGALAAAADAGDDREAVAGDADVDVFEIMFAGMDDFDAVVFPAPGGGEWSGQPFVVARLFPADRNRAGPESCADDRHIAPQGGAGVALFALRDLLRRAGADDLAAGLASLGAEVDEPVGGADDVEVVFDDDQRMPLGEQPAEGAEQGGDIVEMQAGGRFVEQKQGAGPLIVAPPGAGEVAGQLEALGFAAGEGRHRLTELEVIEPHRLQGSELAQHLGGVGEKDDRLGNGHLQHLGHRATRPAARGVQLHFEDFRPVAAAVAVGAAQVDVAQKLHLHMFEAVAAAGRATAVAGVEAEGAGGIAALGGQRLGGKQLADAIEGPDVAGRVGAGGLADGGLIDQHRLRDQLVAVDGPVGSRRLHRFALELGQGVVADLLHQGRLARPAHPGDAHQPVEGDRHIDPLEVVGRGPENPQARGVRPRRLGNDVVRKHRAAPAEIVGGKGAAGAAQLLRRTEEDDFAAPFAGAGAKVDDAVGGQHHLRVVLHHQQRIARIPQPVEHPHHPLHVSGVQADARFVEDEQGADQRGAQGRGQVDALHLAPREGAGLAVEGKVAEPHLGEVAQPRTDFAQQHVGRLVQGRGQLQPIEEFPAALDGQQHDIVQGQPGQGGEALGREVHPLRAEAPLRGQHPVGVGRRTQSPEQGLGLETRPPAVGAGVVGPVLGEQHPDVHLVALGLEPVEETLGAVPQPVLPASFAFDHPAPLLPGQLAPGDIDGDPARSGVAQQIVLAFAVALGLPGLERPFGEAFRLVGDHQGVVDPHGPAEPATGLAGADRGIEGEDVGRGGLVGQVAVGAVQVGGEEPGGQGLPVRADGVDGDPAVAGLEGRFEALDDARPALGAELDAVLNDLEAVLVLGVNPRISLAGEQVLDLGGREVVGDRHGKGDQRPPGPLRGGGQQLLEDAVRRVSPHRPAAAAAEQPGRPGKEELEVVVELGHGADGGAGGAHRVGLVDGNGRRNPLDAVDLRLVHAVEKLPGVGREGLHVATLALGIDRVEGQRRFARTAHPGNHDQFPQRQAQFEILQVVLAGTLNQDAGGVFGHAENPEGRVGRFRS